jgi:hypothetical protein
MYDKNKSNRQILGGNIDRDPVGRKLTPEARERAIDFANEVWKGNMGNGQASKIGIKHVTNNIFKED